MSVYIAWLFGAWIILLLLAVNTLMLQRNRYRAAWKELLLLQATLSNRLMECDVKIINLGREVVRLKREAEKK